MNNIEFIFDKIFTQVATNELYSTPFDVIATKTFTNPSIHQTIHRLCRKPIEMIQDHLTSKSYQFRFLFGKLKKKINVCILLNDIARLRELLVVGYTGDDHSLPLVVLNNRLDMLELVTGKWNNELLMWCAEFGHEAMYFTLRQQLTPNISIYQKAVLSNSLKIVEDVSQLIGISRNILEATFPMNHTDIILYLVNEAVNNDVSLPTELLVYPIINENYTLLAALEELNVVVWHHELYYAAVLSGSKKMIELVESRLPGVHDDHVLDTNVAKIQRGYQSLLLDDIIYNKKYFSHTMNYAVQSKSREVVEYVHQKGYGITISNIVTAIKTGIPDILTYLLQHYHQPLPGYLIHYLGLKSFVVNKMAMAQVLMSSELQENITLNDYRKETLHLELIEQADVLEDQVEDVDYLMQYAAFFVAPIGYKLNEKLITKLRICLELNLVTELEMLVSESDRQQVMDCLYLFGSIQQIQQYYDVDVIPSTLIVMETVCYNQLNKLCFLISHGLLSEESREYLQHLIPMLAGDGCLMWDKMFKGVPLLKYVLLSRNVELIKTRLNEQFDYEQLQLLVAVDDVELVKKFDFRGVDEGDLIRLIEWARGADLLEMEGYLRSVVKE